MWAVVDNLFSEKPKGPEEGLFIWYQLCWGFVMCLQLSSKDECFDLYICFNIYIIIINIIKHDWQHWPFRVSSESLG